MKTAELCLKLVLKTYGQHSVLYALDVIAIARSKNTQKTRRSSHTFLAGTTQVLLLPLQIYSGTAPAIVKTHSLFG